MFGCRLCAALVLDTRLFGHQVVLSRCCEVASSPEVVVTGGKERPAGAEQAIELQAQLCNLCSEESLCEP
eukprot:699445-Amphidinium_carterae.4